MITSVVTDPVWQFVTAVGQDVTVYVVVVRIVDVKVVVGDEVVMRTVDVRVVVGNEVAVELLGDVLEEVEDTVTDPEHPGAVVLSVRRIVYPEALRSM